ncbi:hypothetical protein ACK3SF_05745 [Candidatus Nanosalina sp. VS9-1]|uniref:hypothetical protein n=1 Tax=Candidatus Nanosalina sp. VS9-1 TaxID=3388566 RepID=UPI0039E1836B
MSYRKSEIFFPDAEEIPVMDQKIKKGGLIGVIFALIAYVIALRNGFNQSTFTLFLYLYVGLGVIASLEFSDLQARGFLDRIVIVAEDEEKKLKKLFSDEEYRIDGTVEKV